MKKNRIMMNLLIIIMLFVVPSIIVYAAPNLILNNDVDSFAMESPIATITIDKSKIDKNNLIFEDPTKIDQLPSNGVIYTYEDGYVYAENVPVNSDYKNMGNFTYVYKDAAIMSDGTRKNLEVIFDKLTYIREYGDQYTDKIQVAFAGDYEAGIPLSFMPMGIDNPGKRFALRSEIKFRVGKGGEVSGDENFILTITDINVERSDTDFYSIINTYGNINYSESVEPMYGISEESDIYLPNTTNLTTNPSSSLNITDGGYGHRFVFDKMKMPLSNDVYDNGLAVLVRAGGASGRTDNGFITRAWGSYGPNSVNSKIHFLYDEITHTSTSSSGENGKIELWTDGTIDSQAKKLDGGTVDSPRIYDVPNGKKVTYKLTPNDSYVLDKLTINGIEKQPTDIIYASDNVTIDYYIYTFDESIRDDQEIIVSWKPLIYTIKFMDGNDIINTVEINKGNTVTRPEDPTKQGYSFDNWYTDTSFSTIYNFNTSINEDKFIYAKFDMIKHKVTYDLNGGETENTLRQVEVEDGYERIIPTFDDIKSTITAPFGKIYAGVEINGVKVNIGENFTVKEDIIIKLLWDNKYVILEGENQIYTIDSNIDIVIKSNGELANLESIKIDGNILDNKNYNTESGSTILTLKPNYLNTLSVGDHEVEFVYQDGNVSTNLKVIEKNKSNDNQVNPQTGDNIITYVITLLLSSFGLILVSVYKKKLMNKD